MRAHIGPFDSKDILEIATAFAEFGWNEPTLQNDLVLQLKKDLK
jgi:hypothetical protein